jgi:hypothetical protein
VVLEGDGPSTDPAVPDGSTLIVIPNARLLKVVSEMTSLYLVRSQG